MQRCTYKVGLLCIDMQYTATGMDEGQVVRRLERGSRAEARLRSLTSLAALSSFRLELLT